MIKKFD